jgi:hypothetical protein
VREFRCQKVVTPISLTIHKQKHLVLGIKLTEHKARKYQIKITTSEITRKFTFHNLEKSDTCIHGQRNKEAMYVEM